jgi:TRAP-type mannitol/chloroaromatic compound transport system substrate-binding protein
MKPMTLIVAVVMLIVGIVIGAVFFKGGEQVETAAVETTTEGDGGAGAGTAPVRWKMASTFPGELVVLGEQGHRLSDRVKAVSNGTIELKFFEPGALVPALEVFDAVSTGAVDTGWSTPGYWAGKVPALQFFTAVPFGPRVDEGMAWIFFGGGLELYQELLARHNMHGIICNAISPEGSGWFREPISGLEDLKGLKMRFFGLGAKVMEKLGVSTQLLAGGDIFPALELGTIDATEFSMPVIDRDLGFHQVAKHYYFPGWHQPSSFGELLINMDRWNSLNANQKILLETVCGDNVRNSIAYGEAIQVEALTSLQASGVTLHKWSPEILAAYEAAWQEVVTEEAKNDPDFARVWESLKTFRDNYTTWREFGYLR